MCSVMGSLETGSSATGAAMDAISLLHLALMRGLLVDAGDGGRCPARLPCRRPGGGLAAAALGLLGDLELLRGGLVAGVDLEGAGELVDRAADVAGLAQHAAAVDVGVGGLEAHALVAGLVAQVLGLLEVGLAVVLEGGVVVFASFGIGAALVPCAGRLRVGEGAEQPRRAPEPRPAEPDRAEAEAEFAGDFAVRGDAAVPIQPALLHSLDPLQVASDAKL